MSDKSRITKAVDFSFVAVCFVCFLETFGLGNQQSPESIQAAGYFAVVIPALLALAIMDVLVEEDAAPRFEHWKTHIKYGLNMFKLPFVLMGIMGMGSMFTSISSEVGSTFIGACVAAVVVVITLHKVITA